jgi:cytochrome c peroxidase
MATPVRNVGDLLKDEFKILQMRIILDSICTRIGTPAPPGAEAGLMKSKNKGGWIRAAFCVTALVSLAGCGGGGSTQSTAATTPATTPTLSAAAVAGQALFADTSLSASGRQSCATCHVPSRAFTADPTTDHGLPVALGGVNMDQTGFRNAPSLAYASFTPPFSIASGPTGGFFRDGRASSLATQAQQPFITPYEMANSDAAEVVGRLQQSAASLAKFITAYGDAALDNADTALQDMGLAIAAYETEDADFHPFSSKYDFWLQGQAQLTAHEQLGLTLFNDPTKGNCTACHPSHVQGYSSHALFTDFTFDNIGVPRNWAIPANNPAAVSPVDGAVLTTVETPVDVPAGGEYAYYDLGLCGPFAPAAFDVNARPVFSATTSLCGLFKVPTLRNVAVTAPYFHNGVFSTLQQVLEWYVTRDINNNTANNPNPVAAGAGGNPYMAVGSFYVGKGGTPDLYEYNDLPAVYDANVNIGEVPYTPPTFGGGQAPTLTSDEIGDIVAFLCTLTDGFDPANPAAYNLPSQCPGAAAASAASNSQGSAP